MTTPAAETKSIGLLADAQLSWFLQSHLDSFTVTGQILPIYRDSAIKTVPSGRENSRPSYRDFAKTHANPDTDGNFPYHRAVSNYTAENQIHSATRLQLIYSGNGKTLVVPFINLYLDALPAHGQFCFGDNFLIP